MQLNTLVPRNGDSLWRKRWNVQGITNRFLVFLLYPREEGGTTRWLKRQANHLLHMQRTPLGQKVCDRICHTVASE